MFLIFAIAEKQIIATPPTATINTARAVSQHLAVRFFTYLPDKTFL